MLQTKELLSQWIKMNPNDPELSFRRTGRSTKIALRAIADCYDNRDKWVLIRDHYHKGDRFLMDYIMDLVSRLEFSGFEFDKNHIAMRLPAEQPSAEARKESE